MMSSTTSNDCWSHYLKQKQVANNPCRLIGMVIDSDHPQKSWSQHRKYLSLCCCSQCSVSDQCWRVQPPKMLSYHKFCSASLRFDVTVWIVCMGHSLKSKPKCHWSNRTARYKRSSQGNSRKIWLLQRCDGLVTLTSYWLCILRFTLKQSCTQQYSTEG